METVESAPGIQDRSDPNPRSRPWPSHAVFFPLAAGHAFLVLPVSVLGIIGWIPAPRSLATGAGHAHEMLFGYGLGVVAGYLLGPLPAPRLFSLVGVWAAARLSFVLFPGSAVAALLNAAFAIGLAAQVAPKYLRAAKKLRNQAFVPVLAGIALAAVAQEVARYEGAWGAQGPLYLEAVLLFALLMLFMGGRIIAPAAAGQFYRQGQNLGPRVQPNFETGLILTMLAALIAAPLPGGRIPTAVVIAAAGAIALIRLLRWRLWAARRRPDLWCLGIGYGWIAVGLAVLSYSVFAGSATATALHALTVGALGTLTFNVMTRIASAHAKRDPAHSRLPVAGTMLIAIATVGRLMAGSWPAGRDVLLAAAASCWSLAFVALFGSLLVWVRRGRGVAVPAEPGRT